MSEWPDHSAELARKVMERVSSETTRYQAAPSRGAAKRLWLVADALSDATQGLVDQDIWKTIYGVRLAAEEELRKLADPS